MLFYQGISSLHPLKVNIHIFFYISFVSIFIPSSRYSLVCSAWFVYKHVNFYYTHSPHPCPAPMISQQELCKNYKTAPLGGTRRGSPHQVAAACIPRLPFICNNLPIRLCGPSRGSQEHSPPLSLERGGEACHPVNLHHHLPTFPDTKQVSNLQWTACFTNSSLEYTDLLDPIHTFLFCISQSSHLFSSMHSVINNGIIVQVKIL